jgi:microcystin-dependent protein
MTLRHSTTVVLATILALPRAANAAVTDSTGSGQPHQNMQPSLGINYVIAIQGTFPSQDGGSGGSTDPYLGEIMMFAGNFAPRGWALAQGQLLQRNQNQGLFALLGATYGGNGVTNFALPDLRGRVPIGTGQGPGMTNRTIAQQTGTESVALSAAQMPPHTHPLPTIGGSTHASGDGETHSEMQPSLVLTHAVATNGVFPPRGGSGGSVVPYIGEIGTFAFNFAPNGWRIADGAILLEDDFPALYSILGSYYGGNGTTTFALPDLRGRSPMGFGQGPGLTLRDLGDQVGAEATTLTTAQLPSHSHTLPGGSTGTAGSAASHSNMQPSLGLNYIIAAHGIFPTPAGAGGEGDSNEGGSGGGGEYPYIGEIRLFGGSYAPEGWFFANGQTLSISTHNALYQIIGTTYGGNGVTTFQLPDLQSRLAVGIGQGTGLSNQQLGEVDGVESVALTAEQLPAHSHIYSPLAGDFNLDGLVDAADYVMWRKGGPNFVPADYNLWRTNFGRTLSGAGSDTPTPEPTSWLLALLLLTAAATCHRAKAVRP